MQAWASVLVWSLMLSACATPVVVAPVQYGGTVAAWSDKSASIRLNAGIADTSATPAKRGAFVPVASGRYPALRFDEHDQRFFIENLQHELVRLGMFRMVSRASARDEQTDVSIELLFTQTHHDARRQQYILDVIMLIRSNGNRLAAEYRVVTEPQEMRSISRSQAAVRGKQDAAQRLMNFLIPDIEAFLRRTHTPSNVPIVVSAAAGASEARGPAYCILYGVWFDE